MEVWTLKRSVQLFLLLILLHMLGWVACFTVNITTWIQIILILLIATSLVYYLKHFLRLADTACLMFSQATGFQLRIDDQLYSGLTLLPTTIVSPWLVIVRIKTSQKKVIGIIIFNDGLEQQGGYQALCRQLILNT